MAMKENKAKAATEPEEAPVPEAAAENRAGPAQDSGAQQPGAASAGFSVYLGPNFPGLIQTGTIYPVGREEALALPEVQAAVARKPGIAVLVVDGLTLPEDRLRVKTKGTELAKAYAAVRN